MEHQNSEWRETVANFKRLTNSVSFPRHNVVALTIALFQLTVVGWLDYVTSYEISLAIFYYLPIAYAAWNLGRAWAFSFSILCAVTLTVAEIASGRTYSSNWILAERSLMRLLVFGFVAFSFNFFRRSIEREREKVRHLQGIMTICSCCRKLQEPDGNWSDLESLLRQEESSKPEMKLCPTCAREAYARGPATSKP